MNRDSMEFVASLLPTESRERALLAHDAEQRDRITALEAVFGHRLIDTPNWDTRIRCSCGEDWRSRAEWGFHIGHVLEAAHTLLESTLEVGD